MIKLGNGQFWNGDCLDIMKLIPSGSVDLVLTDPPYRVISGGNKSNVSMSKSLGGNNGKIFEHNDITFKEWIPEVFRVLKNGSHAYFMTNTINLEEMLFISRNAGFHLHNVLIWEKNNINANRWYMKHTEIVLFFCKKPAKTINFPGSRQIFKANNPTDKRHPTEKPIELMIEYIRNSSEENQLVFDPFAGSGTTAIAAERTGRKWICIEKDIAFYLGAVGRVWKEVNE